LVGSTFARLRFKQSKPNQTKLLENLSKTLEKKSIKQGQNGLNKISADDAVSGKFYFL